MARTTSKKETKKDVPAWYKDSENSIMIHGEVNKITHSSEKCISFKVETVKKTPKGNYAHQWIDCISFDEELELQEGDLVDVTGYLTNNNYDGKNGKMYTYQVVCTECEVNDYIPFN